MDGHPERVFFFENPKFLGIGRQIGHFGYYFQSRTSILALSIGCCFLQKKTLDFRPKAYKSQINPKYDIHRKEFGR